ncbi:MAG TPA: histidinol dehydrogenase [Terriglobales bacterium]|jgi:histidinol dehydrogenase|nr:histidinol dehydrogenase [Terriglobales bacterium]
MRISSGRAAEAQVRKLAARSTQLDAVEAPVRRIVNDVRKHGDVALRKYAKRWDGLGEKDSIQVSDLTTAWGTSAPEFKSALKQAAANIRQFCEWQKPKEWRRSSKGISLGQLVRPLESVGCYVPGGRYPLVSTLLMTVIPAQVAAVKNIRVVSPQPRPEVLAAAGMLGITEFYRVGGAQAIAALAYGTQSIPRVDKIVGPGNTYVTAAKKLVSFDCAIDMLAGPTEVLILSDNGDASFIASDLVAQSEHDPETLAIFITTSKNLAKAIVAKATAMSATNAIATKSLSANGQVLIAASRKQAQDWANQIAPEHITADAADIPHIRNAGSVFVGGYSPQAAGDYAVGPNHVLPTAGAARFRGGLSVLDFVKLITVQELSNQGLKKIAPVVELLATTEGLTAHAESVRVRRANA